MPVIPFITDTPELIDQSIHEAIKAGADFIIFGGMTLKEGKQKDYYIRSILEHYPELELEYENIYRGNKWGSASREYYETINYTFDAIAKKYKVPKRIPSYMFNNLLHENDLVTVILEQIDYLLKLKGYKSNFGYAAYTISRLEYSLSSRRAELGTLRGIGPAIRKIIWEILDTGTSKYYENLLIS